MTQEIITIELPHLFRIKSQALKIYRSELNLPTSKDLGLHGTTRAALRTLCKTGTLSYSSSKKSSYLIMVIIIIMVMVIIKIFIYYSSCNLLHCINIHSLFPILFISTNVIIIIICIILITPIFTFDYLYTLISTNVIECSSSLLNVHHLSWMFIISLECSSPLLNVHHLSWMFITSLECSSSLLNVHHLS